eukprot:6214824-Pleurochrysis_carterae.AAC.1
MVSRQASFDMRGQVVAVTGGATGIGRAICQAFVQAHAAAVYNLDIADGSLEGVTWIKCALLCASDPSDHRMRLVLKLNECM